MLSRPKISFLNSLKKKKNRDQNGLYLLEGHKSVQLAMQLVPELISSIYVISDCMEDYLSVREKLVEVDERGLKKISNQQNPQGVIALIEKSSGEINWSTAGNSLCLYLDGVQDPGNVGTLIRSCDWFGVNYLFLGAECADLYNPKVLQSAMGSHFGLNVIHVEFEELIQKLNPQNILGAHMEGVDWRKTEMGTSGLLCLGSEGSGLSEEVRERCTGFIKIEGRAGRIADSLNVAMVGSILLSQLTAKS